MPRSLCRVLLFAVLLCAAAPAAARAAEFPAGDCPQYGDLRICTAEVPSFDGTPLDADLTLPAGEPPRGGGHPLIVLLHGFGGDKHDWQSTNDEGDGGDKWRWNSHWFAKRGFYVLSYTARGFRTDADNAPWQPTTPSGSSASLPSGTIQLKSRDAEIRDTQWLSALAAKTFPDLDRERVVVSGGSYGGGESWLQAMQPDWTFPRSVDPSLPDAEAEGRGAEVRLDRPRVLARPARPRQPVHGGGRARRRAAARRRQALLRQRLLRARQHRRHLRDRHAHCGPAAAARARSASRSGRRGSPTPATPTPTPTRSSRRRGAG